MKNIFLKIIKTIFYVLFGSIMTWGTLVNFFLLFGRDIFGRPTCVALVEQGIKNVGLPFAIFLYAVILIICYYIGKDFLKQLIEKD